VNLLLEGMIRDGKRILKASREGEEKGFNEKREAPKAPCATQCWLNGRRKREGTVLKHFGEEKRTTGSAGIHSFSSIDKNIRRVLKGKALAREEKRAGRETGEFRRGLKSNARNGGRGKPDSAGRMVLRVSD